MEFKNLYKIDPDTRQLTATNLAYTPKVSLDWQVLCMSFNHLDSYQKRTDYVEQNKFFNEELMKFLFDREIYYLTKFKDKPYCPKIINVDNINQNIYIEYGGRTCNNIIYSDESLADFCIDWEEQLFYIINDLYKSRFIKISLYPHCFYIKNGRLYTIDFYGCADLDNPYIEIDKIKGILGNNNPERFIEANENGKLNILTLFNNALRTYIKWPNNALLDVYRRLYG